MSRGRALGPLALPLLWLAVSLLLPPAVGDGAILLDGLRLIQGLPPQDPAQAAPPLQAFAALVLRLSHPGDPLGVLVEAVRADPRPHLAVVAAALSGMMALALAALGWAMLGLTGRWPPMLLAQASPFLTPLLAGQGSRVEPAAILVVAAGLTLAVLLWSLARARPTERQAGWIGAMLGLGLACDAAFAPLALLPAALLDRRRLVVLALSTLAAGLIFRAPALPSWSGWGGPPDPDAALALLARQPLLAVTLSASLLALAGYARLRRRGLLAPEPLARLLAGIVLAQAAGVLLVGGRRDEADLLPGLMLVGPAWACLWRLGTPVFPAAGRRRFWRGAGLVATVLAARTLWLLAKE